MKAVRMNDSAGSGAMFWCSQLLNAIILNMDVTVMAKVIVAGLGALLTLVTLLNQIDVMMAKLPKWIGWWRAKLRKHKSNK